MELKDLKVDIIHASAGAGHENAAKAIFHALIKAGVPADNLRVIDSLDYSSAFFKKSYVGIYFWIVKHMPSLWGVLYDLLDTEWIYKLVRPFRQIYNNVHGKKLIQSVQKQDADIIINTHFFASEFLGRAKLAGEIKAKLMTVLTDYRPMTLWQNPGTDLYWVGSEEAKDLLFKRGVVAHQIIVGGVPIDEVFSQELNSEALEHKFGLRKDRLTLLLTSGSFGLGPQEEILESLQAFKDHIQCLVVCGKNVELQKKLESRRFPFHTKVFGYVDFMHELMEVSDLMIAKPGGASTAESFKKVVPMVIMGAIPGQESYNEEFLVKKDVSFSIKKPQEITSVIESILKKPGLLLQKINNMEFVSFPNASHQIAKKAITLGEERYNEKNNC